MQFAGIDNPFGVDAFAPTVPLPQMDLTPRHIATTRYERKRMPAPKPLSHYLKSYLLRPTDGK